MPSLLRSRRYHTNKKRGNSSGQRRGVRPRGPLGMLLEGTLGRQVAVGGTSPWKTMLIYVMLIIWCLKKTDMLSIFTDAIIGNGGLGDRLQQLSSVAGSRGRRKKDDKQLETKYRYLIQNLNANNKIESK